MNNKFIENEKKINFIITIKFKFINIIITIKLKFIITISKYFFTIDIYFLYS